MTAPDPLTAEESETVERIGGKGDRLSVDALELLAIIDRLVSERRDAPDEPLAEATTVVQRDDVDGNFIQPSRIPVPSGVPGERVRVEVRREGTGKDVSK